MDCSSQDFAWSWYFSQTCNLQAEFVYILSAQSRQTNSACRLQVWSTYQDQAKPWIGLKYLSENLGTTAVAPVAPAVTSLRADCPLISQRTFEDQFKLKIKWLMKSLQKCALYAQKCAQHKKRCVVRKRAIGLQMSDAWCLFRGFLTTHT